MLDMKDCFKMLLNFGRKCIIHPKKWCFNGDFILNTVHFFGNKYWKFSIVTAAFMYLMGKPIGEPGLIL